MKKYINVTSQELFNQAMIGLSSDVERKLKAINDTIVSSNMETFAVVEHLIEQLYTVLKARNQSGQKLAMEVLNSYNKEEIKD